LRIFLDELTSITQSVQYAAILMSKIRALNTGNTKDNNFPKLLLGIELVAVVHF
jgi:hypothetical protein